MKLWSLWSLLHSTGKRIWLAVTSIIWELMANNVSYGVRLPEFKPSCGLVSVSKQRHS